MNEAFTLVSDVDTKELNLRIIDTGELIKNINIILQAVRISNPAIRDVVCKILDRIKPDFSRFVLDSEDIDAQVAELLQRPEILDKLSHFRYENAVEKIVGDYLGQAIERKRADPESPVPAAAFTGGQAVGKRYTMGLVGDRIRERYGDSVRVRRISMESGWGLGMSRREDMSVFGKFALKGALGFRMFMHNIREGQPGYVPFYDMRTGRRLRLLDTAPYTPDVPVPEQRITDEKAFTRDIRPLIEELISRGAVEVREKAATLLRIFDEDGNWLVRDEHLKGVLEERIQAILGHPGGWDRKVRPEWIYIDITERKKGEFITGDFIERIDSADNDVFLVSSRLAGNREVFRPDERRRVFDVLTAVWAPVEIRKMQVLKHFEQQEIYQYMEKDAILRGFDRRLPEELRCIVPTFLEADIVIKNSVGYTVPGAEPVTGVIRRRVREKMSDRMLLGMPRSVADELGGTGIDGIAGIGDVVLRVIDDGEKEDMLDELSALKKETGAAAVALIDVNADTRDLENIIRNFVAETSERLFILGHPEIMTLRDRGTLAGIKDLPSLVREIADKYLGTVASLGLSRANIYEMRIHNRYEAFTAERSGDSNLVAISPSGAEKRDIHYLVHYEDGQRLTDKKAGTVLPVGLEIEKRRKRMDVSRRDDPLRDRIFVMAPSGTVTGSQKAVFKRELTRAWMLNGVVDPENVVILDRREGGYTNTDIFHLLRSGEEEATKKNTGIRTLRGELGYEDGTLLQIDMVPGARNNINQYEILVNLLVSDEGEGLSGIPGLNKGEKGRLFVYIPQASPVDLEAEIRNYQQYIREVLVKA
ncbi:MAG: hypothetical protein GF392_02970 [Candidatus Omnitrophica bacterium]|nr:hypothetical protein [Candidatus Omnitrophota bacterium]